MSNNYEYGKQFQQLAELYRQQQANNDALQRQQIEAELQRRIQEYEQQVNSRMPAPYTPIDRGVDSETLEKYKRLIGEWQNPADEEYEKEKKRKAREKAKERARKKRVKNAKILEKLLGHAIQEKET